VQHIRNFLHSILSCKKIIFDYFLVHFHITVLLSHSLLKK
jgi:hypothetical protein